MLWVPFYSLESKFVAFALYACLSFTGDLFFYSFDKDWPLLTFGIIVVDFFKGDGDLLLVPLRSTTFPSLLKIGPLAAGATFFEKVYLRVKALRSGEVLRFEKLFALRSTLMDDFFRGSCLKPAPFFLPFFLVLVCSRVSSSDWSAIPIWSFSLFSSSLSIMSLTFSSTPQGNP